MGAMFLDDLVTRFKIDDKDFKQKSKDMSSSGKKLLDSFLTLGAGAITFGALVAGLKQVTKAADESARVEAKLEAVYLSTDAAVGVSLDTLKDYGDELSKLTGIDDEVIANGEAVLLTFKEIGGEVFPEATAAALDMSAVLDQDLKSSTIQIGKLLNVTKGDISAVSLAMSAAKKSGVSFTTEQVEMAKQLVKTGDIIGYQKLVLGELQVEFGGAAKRIHDAGSGADSLNVSFGNLQETIGKKLLPHQRQFNNTLTKLIDLTIDAFDAESAWLTAVERGVVTQEEANLQINKFTWTSYKAVDALRELDTRTDKWNDTFESFDANLLKGIPDLEEFEDGITDVSDSFGGFLSVAKDINKENENHVDKLADIEKKMKENREEAEKLYPWQLEKVQELDDKYKDLGAQYADEMVSHQTRTNSILGDLLLQQLSIDDLSEAEALAYTQWMVDQGLIDEGAVKNAESMFAVTSAVADGRIELEEMQEALELMSKGYSIDVSLNLAGGGWNLLENGLWSNGGIKSPKPRKYASGGMVPGAIGEPQLAIVHGGENVQTPAQQAQSGAQMDYKKLGRVLTDSFREAMLLSGA